MGRMPPNVENPRQLARGNNVPLDRLDHEVVRLNVGERPCSHGRDLGVHPLPHARDLREHLVDDREGHETR